MSSFEEWKAPQDTLYREGVNDRNRLSMFMSNFFGLFFSCKCRVQDMQGKIIYIIFGIKTAYSSFLHIWHKLQVVCTCNFPITSGSVGKLKYGRVVLLFFILL